MSDKKIASARIEVVSILPGFPGCYHEVRAKLEGEDAEQSLFDYYPDEINFSAEEFVGLTLKEAHQLHYERDLKYLRS